MSSLRSSGGRRRRNTLTHTTTLSQQKAKVITIMRPSYFDVPDRRHSILSKPDLTARPSMVQVLKKHYNADEPSYVQQTEKLPTGGEIFKQAFDVNSTQGILSRESLRFSPGVRRVLAQIWNWVDVDKNGSIDLEEYTRYSDCMKLAFTF